MKNTLQFIFAITVLTFAISCGNTTEKKLEQSKPEQTEETAHDDNTILRLNDGNLWTANTETTDGINTMIAMMSIFTEKENLDAYATLKQNLEKEFGTIITKCSMKGEPHNQLHNFLMPMKPYFNGLGSSDLDNCKKNFDRLQAHLLEYANFFE